MRSLLLFLSLILISTSIRAQDNIRQEIDSIKAFLEIDTAFNNRLFPHDTTPDYFNSVWYYVEDSITNMVVKKYVEQDVIQKGNYPYPSLALDIQYSYTYVYLLQQKYNIHSPVSHGCVVPYYQNEYDTLVAVALSKKYGKNIFERTFEEAARLDKHKKGLCLPSLKDSINILSYLKKEIPYWDTMCRVASPDRTLEYLIITFEGNKLVHTALAERAFWGIQTLLGVEMSGGPVEAALNKLKWQPALFNGKPIKRNIALNLLTNEISWLNYWD